MSRHNENPFAEEYDPSEADEGLVDRIKSGARDALEKLILRHQAWIYNIALKMTGEPEDARDVTQEVLIKMTSRLSTFRGESKFRTWLYRITANHVLNMKKSKSETQVTGFADYGQGLDNAPELEIPDHRHWPEKAVLVEEGKITCMSAMLLCLDRDQRLVFILGEILDVTDKTGAEVLDITRGNFRQKLSRAREQLYGFMNNKCGLVNKANPCRCAKKTAAFIRAGYVDPESLSFDPEHVVRIHERARRSSANVTMAVEESYKRIYREHPYHEPRNLSGIVSELIDNERFKAIFGI